LKNLNSNNADNTATTDPAVAADAVGTAVGFDAQKEAAKNVATSDDTVTWATAALTGTGYGINLNTAANQSALLAAKTGDTITLNVTKGDTVVTPITFYKDSGSGSVAATPLDRYTSNDQTATATTVIIPLTTGFTGVSGANYTADALSSFLTTNKVNKLYTPTYTKTVSDASVNYYTVYTLKNTDAGTYGSTTGAKAYYTAEEVQGESPAKLSSDTTGNIVGNGDATTSTSSSTDSKSASSSASSSDAAVASSDTDSTPAK